MLSLREKCIYFILSNWETIGAKTVQSAPSVIIELLFRTFTSWGVLNADILAHLSSDSTKEIIFSSPISKQTLVTLHNRAPRIESIRFYPGSKLTSKQIKQLNNFFGLKKIHAPMSTFNSHNFVQLGHLQELNLSKCTELSSHFVVKMVSCFKKLRILDISCIPSIDVAAIQEIVSICKGLESINCSHCPLISSSVISLLSHLQTVILIGCNWSSGDSFQFANKSAELRRLDIASKVAHKSDDFLTAIATNFPKLESLNFVCMEKLENSLCEIARCCTRLSSLMTSDCTKDGFMRMAEQMKINRIQPTKLSLLGCQDVDDAVIEALYPSLSEMRDLNLSGIFNIELSLVDISQYCPRLVHLDLSYCSKVSNAAVVKLARNCNQLSRLELYMCTAIGDEGIIALADHCPLLSHLTIYGLVNVTAEGFNSLATKLPLSYFDCSSTQILDETIARFMNCPLTSLICRSCKSVADDGLIAIIRNCSQLKKLSINGCKLVTDKILYEIGTSLRLIEELSLLGCLQTTGAGILNVALRCKLMRSIHISTATQITTNQVNSIKSVNPNLTFCIT